MDVHPNKPFKNHMSQAGVLCARGVSFIQTQHDARHMPIEECCCTALSTRTHHPHGHMTHTGKPRDQWGEAIFYTSARGRGLAETIVIQQQKRKKG